MTTGYRARLPSLDRLAAVWNLIVAMYIDSMYSIAMTRPTENPTPGYLLWRLTTKMRAAVDRALAPLGLTHAQYSLLASLYGYSFSGAQPSQRELADWTGLDPRSTSPSSPAPSNRPA
jgi:hypothetical protein